MNPWRWVQQTGEIEKATGYKINWRQFGGGGDVIRAMASGDVQLGEVGSTGIATAISQGMDVELFWILDDIAAAEALVVRNGSGINIDRRSEGQEDRDAVRLDGALPVAVRAEQGRHQAERRADPQHAPAGSRRSMGARRHRRDVHLGPGAVDRQEGRQGADDVGRHLQAGRCTFDGLVVTRKFAKENPAFMVALVKAIAKADADYKANPKASGRRLATKAKAVAKWSGGKAEDVPDVDEALRLPEPAGAGVAGMARRRRERRRGEGAHAAGELPEGAGPAAVGRAGLLASRVTTEWVTQGDEVTGRRSPRRHRGTCVSASAIRRHAMPLRIESTAGCVGTLSGGVRHPGAAVLIMSVP